MISFGFLCGLMIKDECELFRMWAIKNLDKLVMNLSPERSSLKEISRFITVMFGHKEVSACSKELQSTRF